MTVGIDTYVTVEDAEQYIASHYRRSSAQRKRWSLLADDDKAVLLVQACAAMESLPYHGRKAICDQPLSFPRLPYQYGNAEGAPLRVKQAQIEQALWLSDEAGQEERNTRTELQEQGVKSYSLGDLSETFEGSNSRNTSVCRIAKELLAAYLSGGYSIL